MSGYQSIPGSFLESSSGLAVTTRDRPPLTPSDRLVATKSTATSTRSHPIPKTIFGQPVEMFTLHSVKKILSLFRKQGSIRKTSTLQTLLPKILDLESKITSDERVTVAQLLANNLPLTRFKLSEGPTVYDDAGEKVFAGKDRTCAICFDSLPAGMFRTGIHGFKMGELTMKCPYNGHHSVCTDCVRGYVVAKCGDTQWHDITCPLCPGKFAASTVEKYLSGELLVNYKEYMRTFAMRNLPGFRWCLGASCKSGQVHAPGDESPKMICQKCRFATCYSHQLPWHHGKTCEQAGGLKSKEDRDSEAWIQSQTKECPGCGVATVKNGGCDGIYCHCGTSWDWGTTLGYR
ncbi:hypothetical protein DSL72_003241 [Monilinia vaccinii-corymbosi]|uniref:RBR-type E3 ubiquitin transferase n=1 Tax=Monilinia vaccinii-corymbosi TaxID=61207 RepID=A0A8A3P7P8_9HELO|nr:hypothetical protein DSL72_003241 [Monilinia vaccinii-corymbosi]